jgi:hypothetical protein
MASVSLQNTGKQSPLWFRKLKKIWSNTETLVIGILLLKGYTDGSLVMLLVKMGSQTLFENLDTILAHDVDEPVKLDQ